MSCEENTLYFWQTWRENYHTCIVSFSTWIQLHTTTRTWSPFLILWQCNRFIKLIILGLFSVKICGVWSLPWKPGVGSLKFYAYNIWTSLKNVFRGQNWMFSTNVRTYNSFKTVALPKLVDLTQFAQNYGVGAFFDVLYSISLIPHLMLCLPHTLHIHGCSIHDLLNY